MTKTIIIIKIILKKTISTNKYDDNICSFFFDTNHCKGSQMQAHFPIVYILFPKWYCSKERSLRGWNTSFSMTLLWMSSHIFSIPSISVVFLFAILSLLTASSSASLFNTCNTITTVSGDLVYFDLSFASAAGVISGLLFSTHFLCNNKIKTFLPVKW